LITMTLKIWVWHSFLIRFPYVKRVILPSKTIILHWIGSSNPFESFRLQHRHIQMLREWRNSEFVSSQMDYREPISEEQQEQWFASLNPQTHHFFIHRYRGEWVGMTHLNLFKTDTQEGEFKIWGENGGFLQSKRWKGTGIAIIMAIHTLDYAFNLCKVGFLRIKVHRENQEAIQLNMTLGYNKVGALNADFDRYELQAHEYWKRADKLKQLTRLLV
jgi:RimJ/RimL family protein N-acetyltransferase